jgi:hypothetical protein
MGVLRKPMAEVRKESELLRPNVGYYGIGQASLIHSSSTIHYGSQKMWDDWVKQNILQQPQLNDFEIVVSTIPENFERLPRLLQNFRDAGLSNFMLD